jgi:hypothetical protein
MRERNSILSAVALALIVGIAVGPILLQLQEADAARFRSSVTRTNGGLSGNDQAAPLAVTGDNVYVAWWTNNTANQNEEVMFRVSTDGGVTFGDKINLSNSTNADSWKVEIDSDAESVAVSWWETNQTVDTPVMRVSTDNGATFGPMLMLATNGTIGEAAEEEPEEGE